MIKTKIIETTEKYDKDGKLVEKITREEITEDAETRYPSCYTNSFGVHATLLNHNCSLIREDK